MGGAIGAEWARKGWETGAHGYPITDEWRAPDGSGRFNHFQNNSSIYWHPATGPTAFTVWGAIRENWASRGWETGRFGYPRGNEYQFEDGWAQNFQGSTIDWKPGDPVNPADVIEPDGPRWVDYDWNPTSPDAALVPVPPESAEASEAPVPPEATPEKEQVPSAPLPAEIPSETPSGATAVPAPTPAAPRPAFHGIVGPLRQQDTPDEPDLGQCSVQPDNPHGSNNNADQIHTRIRSYCPAPGLYDHEVSGATKRLRWWGQRFPPFSYLPEAGDPAHFGPSTYARIRTTTAVWCSRGSVYDYQIRFSGSFKIGNRTYTAGGNHVFKKVHCFNDRW
ncbi:hypothetical protein [Rhodococcus aetherivorans]|uniref:LGFP repeat-containing protein n=1 Tax=Rhodococcus aetherivorans TaxID=191292 RepID=UPI003CD03DD2